MGKENGEKNTFGDILEEAQNKKEKDLNRKQSRKGKQTAKNGVASAEELPTSLAETEDGQTKKTDDPAEVGKIKKWNEGMDIKDATPAQLAALHTMSKIKDYSELHAETEKEGNELMLELTKKFWKEFAVHGTPVPDGKGGMKIESKTDLDGEGFIEILKQAGFDTSKISYIAHKEYLPGGFTGDASGRHGISTPDGGESLIGDHHAKESDRTTSATKFAYEMLVDFGLLKKDNEVLKKFVDLVTDQDNENYTDKEIKYLFDSKDKRFPRTIIGLSKYLTTDQILALLEKNGDYKKALPSGVLKKVDGCDPVTKQKKTLEEFSKEVTKRILASEKYVRETSDAGFEINSGDENFGKILIDTGRIKAVGNGEKEGYANKIGEGFLPVRAAGYGAYIVYIPEQKRFKILTKKPLGEIEFDQGFNVRGSFWYKPGNDGKEITVTLEDILSKLCGRKVAIEGKLQEAMDKDKEQKNIFQENIKKNNELITELRGKINPTNFDEKIYEKKYREEAESLRNQLEKIAATKIGSKNRGEEFMQWEQKVRAINGMEKSINLFLKRMERVKSGNEPEESIEKKELSEKEREYISAYVTFVENVKLDMQKHFSEENGYDAADIPVSMQAEEKRFWSYVLPNKLKENDKISEENIPLAMEEIKKQAEKE